MNMCVRFLLAMFLSAPVLFAQQIPQSQPAQQQPAGMDDALREMTSQHVNRTAFTFDHNMLQSALGLLNNGEGDAGPLIFEQSVEGDGLLLAEGKVHVVAIKGGRSARPPREILAAIKPA